MFQHNMLRRALSLLLCNKTTCALLTTPGACVDCRASLSTLNLSLSLSITMSSTPPGIVVSVVISWVMPGACVGRLTE